jgi:subfamily B ATP-binding cassette protein MsbA
MGSPVRIRHHVTVLFRDRKALVLRFALTSLGRAAFGMAAILLIRDFLSGVLGERGGLASAAAAAFGPTAALWVVAVLLLGAYVAQSACSYDNQVSQQHIIKVLELGLMERLIRHLLSLSVPFFDRQSHGDIIQAVRQDVSNLRVVVLAFAALFVEGASAVGLLAAALWLSLRLTLLALVALPVAVIPLWLIARMILQRSFAVRKRGYVLFDVILQLLRGIRIIKSYRGEEQEARTAVEKGRLYFDALVAMVRVRSLSQALLESLAGLGIVVVILVGGIEVMRGQLSWPALLAFLMAVRALHGPLNNINRSYAEIRNHGASVSRIGELLGTRPEVPDRPDAHPLDRAPRVIEFDNVTFGFGDTTVLQGLAFRVEAGETIGVAGPSGAGKTTLLNLVARFYDPTGGTVRVDHRDLRDYRLADVYDKLAIVTQEPFLFASSLAENIAAGRPDASRGEVEAAARAAEIHDEIVEFPEGYDTLIGIGGRGLSGGQAQRVNIARAILKNAPILLLDEATSSLDSLAEAKVQRAIDRLMEGRTTFTVAHRLSTLRHASRILVLDRGTMVGFAPHGELLEACPLYRRLWETQQLLPPKRREPVLVPAEPVTPSEPAL